MHVPTAQATWLYEVGASLLKMSILQPKKLYGGRAECYLCSGKLGTRHTHPVTWSADTKKFLCDESVCRLIMSKACLTDIRRGTQKWLNAKEQTYCPRCGKSKAKDKCCIPTMSCSEDDKVIKHSFSWEDIRKCIDLDDVDNDCTLTSLCSHHYMIVYKCNKVLPVDPVVCSIFGIKRKREHSPSVCFLKCPNTHLLQPFLSETVDFERHLHSQFKCVTDDSFVQLALHKVALHTCRLLNSDQAFLFPSLYNELSSSTY